MILAIVQARMGSSRLPGKVLYKYKKNTFLEILINRLRKSKLLDEIIIATSYHKNNDVICNLCKSKKIKFFRGAEKDVLSRYYKCAKKYKAKFIVRITSDCPLIDPSLIDKMINIFQKKKLDFISNTVPPKSSYWPDGSDIEIFNFKSLKKANDNENSSHNREHVTFHFWKDKLSSSKFKSYQLKKKYNTSELRYVLDYHEDFLVLKKIMEYLEKNKLFGTYQQVINYLYKNKNIRKINSKYNFGEGWND